MQCDFAIDGKQWTCSRCGRVVASVKRPSARCKSPRRQKPANTPCPHRSPAPVSTIAACGCGSSVSQQPVYRCNIYGVECVERSFRLAAGSKTLCPLRSCLECKFNGENVGLPELDSPIPIRQRWRLPLAPITGVERNYNAGMVQDKSHKDETCLLVAWRAQHRLGQPSSIWIGRWNSETNEVLDARRLNLGGLPSAEDPRLQQIGGEIWLTYATYDPSSPRYVGQRRAVIDKRTLAILSDADEASPFKRAMEKNWTWFQSADHDCPCLLYAAHHVLPSGCGKQFPFVGNLFDARGSCQPVRRGNEFYVWAHSVIRDPHVRYVASLYTFAAHEPYQVCRRANVPLLAAKNGDTGDGTAKSVIFPSGAMFDEAADAWRISYGLHDRWAEVVELSGRDVESLLKEVNP